MFCAACADATARERFFASSCTVFSSQLSLNLFNKLTQQQVVVVFFQLRAGWCSSHVALLALSRDAAADASELAVHSGFPSRCFFVFALLLVDVTRLRQVVLIGCFFCASALPSFEVSGCLVRFMSIS